jgi:hypothetical protein
MLSSRSVAVIGRRLPIASNKRFERDEDGRLALDDTLREAAALRAGQQTLSVGCTTATAQTRRIKPLI